MSHKAQFALRGIIAAIAADFTCQSCGKKFAANDTLEAKVEAFKDTNLNVDMIVPRELKGTFGRENASILCRTCNEEKGNALPEEFYGEEFAQTLRDAARTMPSENEVEIFRDAFCRRYPTSKISKRIMPRKLRRELEANGIL